MLTRDEFDAVIEAAMSFSYGYATDMISEEKLKALIEFSDVNNSVEIFGHLTIGRSESVQQILDWVWRMVSDEN